ncbi:helix-turn-helix transcriptional regulator [Aliiruegeria sabulilitoris]|uniref:helix-turn-helix transcriptional regulator n=1 Tax=Aliiruegeria sabulilitoris TaxID=1510458 RepID=UPI0009E75253|nr:AraC family transcriptional regulator [Pseudoruegeria sp. M32A2M]
MSRNIPLIRAASLMPMVRWLVERGRDPGPFLERAGIGWVCRDDPLLPIPLSGPVRLLVDIARVEGPDAPYRIAGKRGGFEIGFIGAAALQGPTVRAGFRRLSRQMSAHSTHEVFRVRTDGPGLTVTDGWTVNLGDDETLHFVQQYVAGLVDMICSSATGTAPSVAQIGLVPHPRMGVSHLRAWLGERVCGRDDRLLDISVDKAVADMAMPDEVRKYASEKSRFPARPLTQGDTLADDVAALMSSMLPRTKPTVEAVASIAGMSERTFRRCLHAEGVNFSEIVERTRANSALRRLQAPDQPMLKDLARELGYANQETLTRAVRRWTGNTPSEVRAKSR